MDLQKDFYLDASPLLTEFGLLRNYWDIRDRRYPDSKEHPWPS